MSIDDLMDLDSAINSHVVDDEPDPEPKPDGDEPDPEPKPVPKPPRSQQRIETLARERAELRRENEELRRQIDSKPPELPPQPNPQAFTDKDGNFDQRSFDFAVGKWRADVEHIQAEAGQKEQRRIERERDRYNAKMQTEKSIYGDYHASVRALAHQPMTPQLHDALLNEDNATDLFCFLGSHPDIADSVLSLPGYQQSRKLAEISLKLRTAAAKPKKKPSSAAPPVPPVKSGKAPAAKKPLRDMSYEEHVKMMNRGFKQLRGIET